MEDKNIFGTGYEIPKYEEGFKFQYTLADINNTVIKNFFSQEEIDQIRKNIKHGWHVKNHIQAPRAQKYTTGWELPESVRQKVQDTVFDQTGKKWLVADYSVCRYEKMFIEETNSYAQPKLKMHRDENFNTQRICIDYQLESNTSWDMIVGEKRWEMEDNSALLFSSTDQMHGRTPKIFLDGEYMDLIFFHLSEDGAPDNNIS